ncbi:MAG: DUF2130 domain-containing protein [Gammaproteobacteria bacterium]|nr:DUF2130 domain-containing protein [Gammaproteobacteria bacterium]
MTAAQVALERIPEPHIHTAGETCPMCAQPIPNEKAKEIRARMEAQQRRANEDANARADERIAAERGRLREETDKAIAKARAVNETRVEAARGQGRQEAEAALQEKVAAAQKAKTEAERAAVQKVAQADKRKQQALAQLQALKAEQQEHLDARVQEVRGALEKEHAAALANERAESDKDKRKLTAELVKLQRQVEKQRADELGEGAEVNLFDALKEEFPTDNIRRIPKGVSGADILQTVMNNGQDCGTIIYDSKNTGAWRNSYVGKLIRDQTASKADHAVLSTLKFPAGAAQLEVRDGVVVVNPARAVAIAGIIRRHLLTVHTLRLSKTERTEKMAALYHFIMSARCTHLLGRIDSGADELLDLQEAEKRAHDSHWKKQGTLLRSMQKAKSELDVEIDSIICPRDDVA